MLALFAESGLTAADFCREMAVNPTTFSSWRQQAQSESPAEPSEPVEFAEVRVTPPASATGSAVTITLPSGTRLGVQPGTDPVWLAQLVESLR